MNAIDKKSILVVLSLLVLFCYGFEQGGPVIGNAPPQFVLSDLKGKKTAFPDDFKGKVVVIRFWTAVCGYCVREMPTIDAVYAKYRDRGLVVLAINVGQSKELVVTFLANLKISYPVLLDSYSVIAKKYGVESTPMTFIVDKKGIIRGKFIGEVEGKAYEKMIMKML